MNVEVLKDPKELGKKAALRAARVLKDRIAQDGKARIVLSTGASQFDTLEALIGMDVPWEKVDMFHLDEYVRLSANHPASFRKYLQERFVNRVQLKSVNFVDGEGDIGRHIEELTENIRQEPIDLALIGIGENAHIAFNDPPADFETREAFIVVDLDDACKRQQVREGWFPSVEDVPKQAISMTVHQIMQSRVVISCVPYKVKAKAIQQTLEREISPWIPSTILKSHPDWTLFLDEESASLATKELRGRPGPNE